jgi:hypothetical protein
MNIDLCPYKNIFGEENTGSHKKFRLFDIAFYDVIGTVLIAYAIHYYSKQNFYQILLILFLIGIILHRLFCVKTTVDKFLFPDYD